ncbi:hypothetical protein cypCar_00024519 [Cyprinus carpio]|nr:hypothetical protein cypCar_00024519 [Cyprinus carpio]
MNPLCLHFLCVFREFLLSSVNFKGVPAQKRKDEDGKGCWAHSCNRTKAYFESRNFFSVLRWDPPDVPGQTLLYSVQFNLYGTPYEPVTWCQNISTPVCDMTEVMTHVMSDVTSKYHVKVYEDTSRSVFIWLVETDEQYCGDVIYTLTHPGRSSPSENNTFCVTVSGDSTVCARREILPKKSIHAFCSYPRDDISKVEVWSGFDEKLEPQAVFEPQKSESMVNEPSYASQEHCDREWTRNQPDVPVQDSRESSVHYSMCLSNQISSNDTTDETSSDSFGPESFLTLLISNTENSSGPLVVPVRSAKNAEGTPLLSDHVQNNSSYVSDVVASNYRQNSQPEIPPEGQREERTYIMRTDHLQDTAEPDESFINEAEPRIDVIFLDRFMVEIQGLSLPCN